MGAVSKSPVDAEWIMRDYADSENIIGEACQRFQVRG
jgi:hypothetical protein